MNIPARFRCMGHVIRVKIVPEAQWRHDDCVGIYEPAQHCISIKESSQQLMEHTFLHELLHCVFTALGSKHNRDEALVDAAAGLLHQAFTTAKYP